MLFFVGQPTHTGREPESEGLEAILIGPYKAAEANISVMGSTESS
jgi:hypothetical protein